MRKILLLLLLFGATLFLSGQTPKSMFQTPPQSKLSSLKFSATANPAVKRARVVKADTALVNDAKANKLSGLAVGAAKAERVQLNLFDDANYTAALTKVRFGSDGRTLVWTGMLEGQPRSEVTITKIGETLMGNVTTQARALYEIRPVPGESLHVIQEMDRTKVPQELPPRTPPRRPAAAGDLPPTGDDGSVVDVLVVYTTSARQALGGTDAINALIEVAVAETNQGYENSGVMQRVHLVHRREIAYEEVRGNSFNAALDALTAGQDLFASVHAARDQYGADLVSLWINDATAGGLGWLMNPESVAFAPWAFSVVHYGWATGYYSFGHELGHNQGLDHDPGNSAGGPVLPYGRGYQQAQLQPFFRTIMAYQCAANDCPRLNYWSNPDIYYTNLATGIPNQFDEHLALNRTRKTVARFRLSVASTMN